MEATWWGIPAAALIVAVVQLVKASGFPARWAGVLAVGLGVLGGIAWHLWAESALAQAVVQGLLAGLAAAGLWSTGKHMAGGD